MPALNMKATAQTSGQVLDSDKGKAVICCPFSGPAGSPFDRDSSGNYSTGAMSTGIGLGGNRVVSDVDDMGVADDYTPGVTKPDGTAATTAILTAIGGGHSSAASGGEAATTPYDDIPIMFFGNGASRDGSAWSTGHGAKVVTATGTVANGAVVETGFENRSGQTIVSGESVIGFATANTAVVAPDYLYPSITGDVTPAVTAPATAVETYTTDGESPVWDIVGGANQALFSMNASTGALAFLAASSAGTYVVVISVTDASFNVRTAEVTVTVS